MRDCKAHLILALSGIPFGANAYPHTWDTDASDFGLSCFDHPGLVDFLQTGSTINYFYLDSNGAGNSDRVCLPNQRTLINEPTSSYLNYHLGLYSGGHGSLSDLFIEYSPPYAFVEGEGQQFELMVGRYGQVNTDAWLSYEITGSASVGTDYRFASESDIQSTEGIVHIPAWSSDKPRLVVDLLDDNEEEEEETIEISFFSPGVKEGEVNLHDPASSKLLIVDDDGRDTTLTNDYYCTPIDPPYTLYQDGSSAYYAHTLEEYPASYIASRYHSMRFIGEDGIPSDVSDYRVSETSSGDYFVYNTVSGEYFISPDFLNEVSGNVADMRCGDNTRIVFNHSVGIMPSPAPASGWVMPSTLPVITSIVSGPGSLTVNFDADSNPIGYTATCTPENGGDPVISHSTQSPIRVDGLEPGALYSCTVAHYGVVDASVSVSANAGALAPPRTISTIGQWSLAFLSLVLGLVGLISRAGHSMSK